MTSENFYHSSDGDLVIVFIAKWTLFLVLIVKGDGYGCFGHARLAILVNQLLEVVRTDL